jgi:hypothetical protein
MDGATARPFCCRVRPDGLSPGSNGWRTAPAFLFGARPPIITALLAAHDESKPGEPVRIDLPPAWRVRDRP